MTKQQLNRWQNAVEQISARNLKGVEDELRKEYAKSLRRIKKQLKEFIEDYETLSFSKRMEADRLVVIAQQIQSEFNDANKAADEYIQEHKAKQIEAGYYGSWYVMEEMHQLTVDMPILADRYIEQLVYNKVDGKRLSDRLYTNTQKIADVATEELIQGIINGEGYRSIAARIEEHTEATYKQALRIARTEGGQAQSAAKQKEYEEAKKKGIEATKTWLATFDSRTRHSHQAMDGQTVEIEEDFTLPGGHTAQGPRLSGIAREDINCRCTTIKNIDGFPPDLRRDNVTGEIIDFKTYAEWAKEKGFPDPAEQIKAKASKKDVSLKKRATKEIEKTVEDVRNSIPTLSNLADRQKEFMDSRPADMKLTESEKTTIQKQLRDVLSPEKSAIRMRVPESAEIMESITNTHFKNQFETGSSRGSLSEGGRMDASKGLFGTDPEKTKREDFEKYGYIHNKDLEEELNGNDVAMGYGGTIIEFKDTLRERTTFTIDDSLQLATSNSIVASDLNDPQLFVKDRYAERILQQQDNDYFSINTVDDLRKAARTEYIEAQYHGKVTMDDVSTIVIDELSYQDKRFEKLIPIWKEKGIKVKRQAWDDDTARIKVVDVEK